MPPDPKDPTGQNDDAPPPQTVAVALRHERGAENPPRVVATGKGAIAEQILEIAFANGIKVRRDSDLTELLSVLETDSEIPVAAFAAVAQILTYVYRANAEVESKGGETGNDRKVP